MKTLNFRKILEEEKRIQRENERLRDRLLKQGASKACDFKQQENDYKMHFKIRKKNKLVNDSKLLSK